MPSTFLQLVTIVVEAYDPAIRFFVDVLGFELAEDAPATTSSSEEQRELLGERRPAATRTGRAKRWVVVRPPGAETGLLLAQADGDRQQQVVGRQTAGRVGFFLRVDDDAAFEATLGRLRAAGATVHGDPRREPYGRVVVFEDVAGNRWDLLGP